MFVLIFLIPFLFLFLRKHLHVISQIRFLCCHLEISCCLPSGASGSFTAVDAATAVCAAAGQLGDDTDAVRRGEVLHLPHHHVAARAVPSPACPDA